MLKRRKSLRGDTLIEVLFAVTVFSLVAVGSISIMNQGTATAQRALEITLVRQQIDAQAEGLRFLNASYVAAFQKGVSYPADTPAGQWQLMRTSIMDTDASSASKFGSDGETCPTPPEGSFAIDVQNAKFAAPNSDKFSAAQTYSQARYVTVGGNKSLQQSEGLWIEGISADTVNENSQSNAGYIDFHIRACWDSAGQSVPMTLGTIVRLYEPR